MEEILVVVRVGGGGGIFRRRSWEDRPAEQYITRTSLLFRAPIAANRIRRLGKVVLS
jgi:hypothetical protein